MHGQAAELGIAVPEKKITYKFRAPEYCPELIRFFAPHGAHFYIIMSNYNRWGKHYKLKNKEVLLSVP